MSNKFNFDFSKIKVPVFDIPKRFTPEMPDFSENIISHEELTERQINKQNEILQFLKRVTLEQAKTAKKQERNNFRMTILALIFAFISVVPILKEWITPDDTNKLSQNISELENKLLLERKKTSELSIRLFNLQNQVQTLEKQNEEFSKKND